MRWLAVWVVNVMIVSLCAAADVVERRGVEPPLTGEVTVSDAGVTVRTGTGTGATHLVPWDRVRDVRMSDPPTGLDAHLATAEELWRARSRLERGDAAMAEQLFERLFERYRGGTHETALVVAEGLLRCRIERYDLTRAVVPALEVARIRRADVTTDSYATLEAVYDARTSLCMHLPPVWIDQRSAQRLASELSRYEARDDEVVAALAALYRASTTRDELDLNLDRETNRHPGVRLLRDLVTTRSADAGVADAARGRLFRDMRGLAEWSEAWARYHIGVSLRRESDPARAEIGAVELSHLPARFAQQQPYLAGLAVSQLIDVTEASGNAVSAASLRMELARRYAFHPIRRASR